MIVENIVEPRTDSRLVRVWCGLRLVDGSEPFRRRSVIVHEDSNLIEIRWRGAPVDGEVIEGALWRAPKDRTPWARSGLISGNNHLRAHPDSVVSLHWSFELSEEQIGQR